MSKNKKKTEPVIIKKKTNQKLHKFKFPDL